MKAMLKTFLSVLLFSSASAANAQSNIQVFNAYLAVKNDLVQSETKQAAKDILILQKAISASQLVQKKELLSIVDKWVLSDDIDKQRKEFSFLSVQLWPIIKSDKDLVQTVYYQYCPMKKAYWLSTDESIRNPYYGRQMLTCGKTVEKIVK